MKIKFNKTLWIMSFLVMVFVLAGNRCFAETYSDGRLLMGYDGCRYFLSGYYNGYCYNSEGWLMNTLKHDELGEDQYYHYVNDEGDKTIAYCLEHRVSADDTYQYAPTSISASTYMKFYPEDQKEGILATAMYAPQYLGEKSPVEGTNTDDWYWAAQVVIWEFQEGIRRNVDETIGERHTGRFVDKTGTLFTGSSNRHYYNSLFYTDGRSKPAYECYKWIINNLNSKNKIPSFASPVSSGVTTYLMKTADDGTYHVSLDDVYGLGVDFFTEDSGIKITRMGSSYIFRSDKPLEKGKIISGRKIPDKAGEALIVWEAQGAHRQTLMTGTPPASMMYVRLKGELPRGNIFIHKSAEDGIISGVRFKVISESGDEIDVTTDERGNVLLRDLLCGRYLIRECDVPIRYVRPEDVEVTVEYEMTKEVQVFNVLKTVDLVIEKRDAYTDEPLENTVFVVVDLDEKKRSVDTEYITDETGRVLVSGVLKADHDYIIKEIKPPEGYKLDEIEGIELKPTGEQAKEDVVFKNKPYLGFKLTKTTAKGTPLSDAEYTFYRNDEAFMTGITDVNGEIKINDLEPGDYALKETKAPKGRLINDEWERFTISGENHETYELRLINDEKMGTLKIVKTDAKTGNGIAETVFTVYAAEDVVNADGIKYEKGDEIKTIVTGKDGYAISKDLTLGKYYIKETESSEGYIRTDETYGFELTDEVPDAIISIENEKSINPKTGDGSNIGILLMIALLSLCGAFMGFKMID